MNNKDRYKTYKDKNLHIFDYDYTLYDNDKSSFYDNYLREKLTELKTMGKCLTIASHNSSAKEYIHRKSLGHFFDMYICQYPRSKDTMVTEILDKMGYKAEDAIFYDDMEYNVDDVSKLGVASYLVNHLTGIIFENIIIDENNKIISKRMDEIDSSDTDDDIYKNYSDNYSDSNSDNYSDSTSDNSSKSELEQLL
jgi:predicted phosphatase